MEEKQLEAFAKRFNDALDVAGCPPKGSGRQGWVAKRYGVSQKGARKWLEAEGRPKMERYRRIAEDLKLNPFWFMSGNGEKELPESYHDAQEKMDKYGFVEGADKAALVRPDLEYVQEMFEGAGRDLLKALEDAPLEKKEFIRTKIRDFIQLVQDKKAQFANILGVTDEELEAAKNYRENIELAGATQQTGIQSLTIAESSSPKAVELADAILSLSSSGDLEDSKIDAIAALIGYQPGKLSGLMKKTKG